MIHWEYMELLTESSLESGGDCFGVLIKLYYFRLLLYWTPHSIELSAPSEGLQGHSCLHTLVSMYAAHLRPKVYQIRNFYYYCYRGKPWQKRKKGRESGFGPSIWVIEESYNHNTILSAKLKARLTRWDIFESTTATEPRREATSNNLFHLLSALQSLNPPA